MNKLISILTSRPFQWLLFWAVSFSITLHLFSQTDQIRLLDVIYTGLFHLPMIFAVHSHERFLFKRFLLHQKYVGYGLGFFLLLIATYFLYLFTFNELSLWLFPDYYFVAIYSPGEIIAFTLIYLFAATATDIIRSWFSQQQDIARLAQLEEENKRAELQALRAQVNPHFLFNSLNTIYNEALKRSEQAPQLILKLSDMLRYVVDKMDQDKVLIQEEISYLKNYITLHKQRLNEPGKVHFELEGEIGSQRIAPLLLINFIENCFKHADLTADDSFISIRLSVNSSNLLLHCRNTMYSELSSKVKNAGAGLQNAKRRLELAYTDRHDLTINENENTYDIKLNMELD